VSLQGDNLDPSDPAEYIIRAERRHRAVRPDREIAQKELTLLKSLADAIESRLPADLPEDERVRQGIRIAASDPGLSKLVGELEELARLRDGPPLWQKPGHRRDRPH
jgi:hypothetical protein